MTPEHFNSKKKSRAAMLLLNHNPVITMIIDGKLCATTELNQAVVDWALPSREIQMHKGKRKHCNQKSFSRYEFTIHEESKTKCKPFKRAAHLFSRSLSNSI